MSSVTPFFETAVTRPEPSRRLLLVTYSFPPSLAVGGLRWQKLSSMVAERGWGIDVISLAPAFVVEQDQRLLQDLPPNVRVYGVPPRDLLVKRVIHGAWRLLRSLVPKRAGLPVDGGSVSRADVTSTGWIIRPRDLMRSYFAYMELSTMRLWAEDAAALAERIAGSEHRAVVSSGPPHMAHLGGARIARRVGVPHVVDLRDPWSQVQRVSAEFASPVYYKLAATYERAVLAQAALVVSNTEAARRSLAALYPEIAGRTLTVMNGSDDDPLPAPRRGHAFVLAYAGTIYLDRDPRPLFRAAARVIRELALTPNDFSIRFIGDVDKFCGLPLAEMAREAGVAEYLEHGPFRPRGETMQFLAEASMLVSLPLVSLSKDSDMAIPAKIFEYVRFNAWLLVLAHLDSAVGTLLHDTTADVVPPDDETRIAAVLQNRVEAHRRGEIPAPVGADGRFSRRAQAQPLLDRLDDLAADDAEAPRVARAAALGVSR